MNWHDVLPAEVATRQITHDRAYTAWRMHKCGFPPREIAKRLGVRRSMVRHLLLRYEYDKPPVKTYLSSWLDLLMLHQQMKKAT